ncbi:MAG: hypothetical protein JWN00_6220 [Actinomycetia bacterium]|nr:hypothetical protein [Actinomycetes bacterium]
MSTVTIYARVAEDLKAATDQYAADHGMSLASAVADLLGRGLEAATNEGSVHALEARTQELEQELSQIRGAVGSMNERLKQVLGSCTCDQTLTGNDLLINGRCPKCARGLSSVLAGSPDVGGSVERSEVAPFMAGVGVALAVILLAFAASQ